MEEIAGKPQFSQEMTSRMTDVGIRLRDSFDKVSKNRKWIEDRWLKDLRQYKGIYDPTESKDGRKGVIKKSRTFIRITRTKVRAMTARLMEMLFPANKDKCWEIEKSPKPDINMMLPKVQQAIKQLKMQAIGPMIEQGQLPNNPDAIAAAMQQVQVPQEAVEKIVSDIAEEACSAMRTEMEDQLSEIKFRDICGQVLASGNLYGTGILKGPLVQRKTDNMWALNPESGVWEIISKERLVPYAESVSLWDFYPDENATKIEDCEVLYQLHLKNKSQVLDLAMMPGFENSASIIKEYVRTMPDGDHTQRHFEDELATMTETNGTPSGRRGNMKKFAVLEVWVPLFSDDMESIRECMCKKDAAPVPEEEAQEGELSWDGIDADADIPGKPMTQDHADPDGDSDIESDIEEIIEGQVWCNIWLLGPFVIKMAVKPIKKLNHPYHLYYYEKDETSIWGDGLGEIMRDDQIGMNASIRGMMDNAAKTVGPMFEVRIGDLAPGESSRDVYPERIFYTNGMGNQRAVNPIQVESRISEFMSIKQMFEQNIHENTLPSYMHGEQGTGVGRTVGGLSMMMGAANISVKDQVRNFDDGITRGFIPALYDWNMEFNPNPEIKGDFNVVARGSSSLVAKEIRAQQLDTMLMASNNPVDAMIVKRRNLWEEVCKVKDLDYGHLICNEDEYNERKQMADQITAMQQQLAKANQILQEAVKKAPSLMSDINRQLQDQGAQQQ